MSDEYFEELPVSVLARCVDHIKSGIADADPVVRGALMRAAAEGRVTAHAHLVGGQAFVYLAAELDNGQRASMEIAGELVGVFVVDGELAVFDG